ERCKCSQESTLGIFGCINFLKRYDGKGKTKIIGGCVFFLQLHLMWKQDEGLDLLKIDEEHIKKFKLKWEVSEPSSA
ncbi:hypothetical protein Tco_0473835, partial [Tanacetum coccineum]